MLKRWLGGALALVFLFAAVGCEAASTTSASVPVPAASEVEIETPPANGGYLLPDIADIDPLTGLARPEGLAVDTRPVAVMVANNQAALPQRGLAEADVIYELLTEGGITRLMAVYAGPEQVPEVGPVRSTRDGFVQLSTGTDAILVSIGASIYAVNLLSRLEHKTINGIYLGTTAFFFDEERHNHKSNEYCWFTNAEGILNGAGQVELPLNEDAVKALFIFGEGAQPGGTGAYKVEVRYSGVSWSAFYYNPAGLYEKDIFDEAHRDEDGSRLEFTNVFLLEVAAGYKPDGVSMDFDLTGGEGYYFTGGGVQAIRWEKAAPDGQLRLYDRDGEPLLVEPGKSYVGFVPEDIDEAVNYTPKKD